VNKVLVLLQVVGHPRDSKRIKMLMDGGFQVQAAAFTRDYHGGRLPACRVQALGHLRNGHYVARAVQFALAAPRLRRLIELCDVVYASGQDMALLALIAGVGLRKPIAVEVGDLARVQVQSGIFGVLVRKCDRLVTSRCSLLVVVSQGFLDYYYRPLLQLGTQALVIENKLEPASLVRTAVDPSCRSSESPALVTRPMRIGYFGVLRDSWSWSVLSGLVEKYPARFEVVLAGQVVEPQDLVERAKHTPGVSYIGHYRSPDDLPRIYEAVDMVWACYPPMLSDDINLHSGRPNRFYESCFFGRPCFARAGSLFAADVARYGIGPVLDTAGVDETIAAIASFGPRDLEGWRRAIADLAPNVYLYTNEPARLVQAINGLCNRS